MAITTHEARTRGMEDAVLAVARFAVAATASYWDKREHVKARNHLAEVERTTNLARSMRALADKENPT